MKPAIAALILVSASFVPRESDATSQPSSPVLAPDATVAGVSQSQYSARWWQWANRQPYDAKPYKDPTGEACAVDQSGPVFFLAGTDGSGPFHRRCVVPAGKHLFMPIINILATNRPGAGYRCEQLVASSGANNEYLTQTDIRIDGVPVTHVGRYRQQTPDCFDAFPGNADARDYFPAASDGYWLMIAPLRPGSHTISVHAKYNNPDCRCAFRRLEQAFDYVIVVGAPPPRPAPARPLPATKSIHL